MSENNSSKILNLARGMLVFLKTARRQYGVARPGKLMEG
jgi:hypothetical protein